MNPKPSIAGTPDSRFTSRNGSAIIAVLIVAMAFLVVMGSSLRWGLTEKRINDQHVLRHEAKNAAESIVEYGFAELMARFNSDTSFPIDSLHPDNDPLELPESASLFFADTQIDTEELELHGGQLPPGEWMYIDPKDPANEFDPLKGKRAFVREIVVYGKAVAKSRITGNTSSGYTMQQLQVRDAPLFAHAIFYNMDLELHPGPTMDIFGPVHSNADAWLSAVNKITFHEGVFSAGEILHGHKKSQDHPQHGDVFIKDAAGRDVNMYTGGSKNSDNAWMDHRQDDWREESSQKWDGFVQDKAHGTPTLNPVGIEDYEPDDPYTAGNELQNYAYAIIEPVLPESHTNYKGDAVRQEKFAYKAGLILSVEGARTYIPTNSTDPDDDGAPSTYQVKAYKYIRENPLDPTSPPVIDPATGLPKRLAVTLPPQMIGGADAGLQEIDPAEDGIPEPYYRDDSNDRVKGGMYDHRENVPLDMVHFDINRLTQYVDETHPTNAGAGVGSSNLKAYWSDTFDPATEWNGIVYVEFPTGVDGSGMPAGGVTPPANGRSDKVVAGTDRNLALTLMDGQRLPRPGYTNNKGLTVATNAPLYILGNYNADGNSHSDDAQYPDDSLEPPAAVAGDTVTILSNNWIPAYGDNREYSHKGNTNNRKGGYTEISTAILTGLKPTIPDNAVSGSSSNAQSGGAHNFPRFLEDWNGTLTIRGSLVALFESEVHDDAMPDNFGHYYSPPNRDWGFNENFRQGNYPPGTPNTRTFRRTSFRDMNKNEYAQAIEDIWVGES